jgi:hypothetical protein
MADEQVDPPHALRRRVGVRRSAGSAHKTEGRHQGLRRSVPAATWAGHWAQNWGTNSTPLAALGETAIPSKQVRCRNAASEVMGQEALPASQKIRRRHFVSRPPPRVCSVKSRPSEGMPSPARRLTLTIHSLCEPLHLRSQAGPVDVSTGCQSRAKRELQMLL